MRVGEGLERLREVEGSDEIAGEGGGIVVADVVADLELAAIEESELAVGRVAEFGGKCEEVGCLSVDDSYVSIW